MSRLNICCRLSFFFFLNDTPTTEIYTLSLHDALPILIPTSAPAGIVKTYWIPHSSSPLQPPPTIAPAPSPTSAPPKKPPMTQAARRPWPHIPAPVLCGWGRLESPEGGEVATDPHRHHHEHPDGDRHDGRVVWAAPP